MTLPHPPKKAAEGPFRRWKGENYLLLKFGNEIVCRWENSWLHTEPLNDELSRWLKSPSGKRWMEENGVGGGE